MKSKFLVTAAGLCLVLSMAVYSSTKEREASNPGFVIELSTSLDDVLQVLNEVLHDQTIHGTYMYDREPTLTGAVVAQSTPLFPAWKDDGKVFYKIRENVVAPRHFRESTDQGTIAVRYIVTSVNAQHVRLQINAVFFEKAHRVFHPSDGTIESSEYKVIKDRLDALQLAEQEAIETQRRRESQDLAKQTRLRQREDENKRLLAAESSVKDLEQRVDAARHQVERRIKAPGTNLKAAPFRSAANVIALSAYSEVVIVIVTPRWYGVETSDGQRGWVPMDELEPLL